MDYNPFINQSLGCGQCGCEWYGKMDKLSDGNAARVCTHCNTIAIFSLNEQGHWDMVGISDTEAMN